MSDNKTKILFLYTELAEYFLACVRELLKHDVEITIVKWPPNKEAPFKFDLPSEVTFYNKEKFSRKALIRIIEDFKPDIIVSSGWVDKDYIRICRKLRSKNTVTIGIVDNPWKASLKQLTAVALSQLTIKQYFDYLWIPGEPQHKYARLLGFSEKRKLKGYYSADFKKFNDQYLLNKPLKSSSFPHRFIYVARYVEHKGIKDLWTAFIQVHNEMENDWELWCLGTGPLEIQKVKHPKIKHLGFVQPEEMNEYILKTGVFVLPSHFEPWGVAAHEFAAAGFPLICSKEVGASTLFLEDGVNGFVYKAGEIEELKECLKKIIKTSNNTLIEMGEKSVAKAKSITPEKWAKTLLSAVPSKSNVT